MLPILHHEIWPHEVIDFILFFIMSAPFFGLYSAFKLRKWHVFYSSRFLGGLFYASIAATAAAIPIAVVAGRAVFYPKSESIPGLIEMMGLGIIILEFVLFFLVRSWTDLDLDMKRVRKNNEDTSSGTNLPPSDEVNS